MKNKYSEIKKNDSTFAKKSKNTSNNNGIFSVINSMVLVIGIFFLFAGEEASIIGVILIVVSGLSLNKISKKNIKKDFEVHSNEERIIRKYFELHNNDEKIIKKDFELHMKQYGVNISKIIEFGRLETKVIVDDQSKEVIIANIKSFLKNKYSFKKFEYAKLLDFELIENNESIIKGSALKTIAGGLTFGVVGAIIGSNSKKNLDRYCRNLKLIVYLNDLDNALIEISIIDQKIDKRLSKYIKLRKKADELIGVFKYIQSNNVAEKVVSNEGDGEISNSENKNGIGDTVGNSVSKMTKQVVENISNTLDEETINCEKCNATIPKNSKFCIECGNKIRVKTDNKVMCKNCGENVLAGKFCMECGAKLGDEMNRK